MPRKQPFFRQGLGVVPGGVERHLDDAVDVAVRRWKAADIQTEALCNRRAHLVGGEYFSLDLARLDDILGERAQRGFAAHLETQGFHPTEQFSLDVACAREVLGEPGRILLEPRPFRALPDVRTIFSVQHAGNIASIPRISKLISAYHAEIRSYILRSRPALCAAPRRAQCRPPMRERVPFRSGQMSRVIIIGNAATKGELRSVITCPESTGVLSHPLWPCETLPAWGCQLTTRVERTMCGKETASEQRGRGCTQSAGSCGMDRQGSQGA